MRQRAAVLILLFMMGLGISNDASAIPVLQLDLAGGVYDPVTETIVAPGGSFTLYAILTPGEGATQTQINNLLSQTYYVSVALTPQVSTSGSYGSFEFGGTTVDATADMTYGVPPLENLSSLQGFDAQDLSKHDIYPTYFSEFSFTFSPLSRTTAYNTADDPGGLTPNANGTAYYVAFTGDSSLLNFWYNLHFDLYNTVVRSCSGGLVSCTDVDRDMFAPFSHDAETRHSVPEPMSGMALLLGLVGAAGARRHLRRSA